MDTDTSPTPKPLDEAAVAGTGIVGTAQASVAPRLIRDDRAGLTPGPATPSLDDALAAIGPEPADEPKTATRTGSPPSPIAQAIRKELQMLVEVEILDLDTLDAIGAVARKGQQLLSIRNPVARFDAQAQGLNVPSPPTATASMCMPHHAGVMNSPHWAGPSVQAAMQRESKRVREALRESPLAKAVQHEITELLRADSFGVQQLLEILQLATHTASILVSALGLEDDDDHLDHAPGMRFGIYGSPNGGGAIFPGNSPTSPYSSDETYGARVVRELGAKSGAADPEKIVSALVLAREGGLDDVAHHLERQLGLPAKPAGEDAE